ncbi:sugar transferase [Paraliomyxa miuraensis]|uniref:sugar transferase n=1 Tax=Paraliomyxa miuraensis TaxID=376150 RepID=UPI002259CA2A|nr:sugar transferase [Paraliomyxa miuraensis]MCX4246760.1 sugar transferase [Paraliomyxa miuraensis]
MTRHQAVFFRRLIYVYDLIVSTLAFFASLWIRQILAVLQTEGSLPGPLARLDLGPIQIPDYYPLLWGLWPLWFITLYFGESSDFRLPYRRVATRYLRVVGLGLVLFIASTFAFKVAFIARTFVLLFGAVQLVSLMMGRVLMVELLSIFQNQSVDGHRVLVVGRGEQAVAFARSVRTEPPWNNKLIGHVSVPNEVVAPEAPKPVGALRQLDKLLDGQPIDEVVFAVPDEPPETFEEALRHCEERGVEVLLTMPPDVPRAGKIEVAQMTGYDMPLIGMRRTPTSEGSLLLKRLLDFTGALVGILLLSPIMLATVIAIKVTDPGPVIFSQVRSGRNGRKFRMHKFRSMVINAEKLKKELEKHNEMDGPVFKIKHDPRITRVGRFIRKTSIDELPQLFNVLFGEMSLVGPRPPLPSEVAQYKPWQRRRLSVKPGITGPWQVSGRNEISFEEWMKMDLEYIDKWSVWLDLRIIFMTIPVVLIHKGAS